MSINETQLALTVSNEVVDQIKALVEGEIEDATPWIIGLGVAAAVMSAFVFICLIVLLFMVCYMRSEKMKMNYSHTYSGNKKYSRVNDDEHDHDYYSADHHDHYNHHDHNRKKHRKDERHSMTETPRRKYNRETVSGMV